jgi:hemoglobin
MGPASAFSRGERCRGSRGEGGGPGVADRYGAGDVKGSLFERLGGFSRVRLMVSDLYDRILDSERLGPYFQGIDVRRLVDHQTKFVSSLMGGPASFTNEQLTRAHAHLRLSPEEFDEMADLFREVLEDFRVPDADVERLHAHLLSLREHVIGGDRVGAR